MDHAAPPPLHVLYDSGDQPADGGREVVSDLLSSFYGGRLVLPDSRRPPIIANFVATVDGVSTFDRAQPGGAAAVSGGSRADRMLMAILRAAADVILIGAGTLRVTGNHRWTAEELVPGLAGELGAARTRITGDGRPPGLAVVSASGDVPLDHPAFAAAGERAVVITTAAGAGRLAGGTTPVVVAGHDAGLDPLAIIEAIRERLTPGLILTEGGPLLMGSLLSRGLVDELFLTVSPTIAGRTEAVTRPGIVDGFAPAAGRAPRAELVSLRRAADGSLFFRHRIAAPGR